MNEIDSALSYRPAGRIVLRRIGDDLLLIPVSGVAAREARVFPLNRTGAFLWERFANGRPLDDAVRELARSFDVSEEVARTDGLEFMRTLVRENLLVENAT